MGFIKSIGNRVEAKWGEIMPGDAVTVVGKLKFPAFTRGVGTGESLRPVRSKDIQGLFTVEQRIGDFFILTHSGDNKHLTGVHRSNLRKIAVIE